MFCMLSVLIATSYAMWCRSTLAYAVRSGVRYGITVTGTQATAAGSNLTAMVKSYVVASSAGLLSGTSLIQVHYYAPCTTSSTGLCDVSSQSNGDAPGNLMQVSISNYPLTFMPRILGWFRSSTTIESTPLMLSAVSADEIEPSNDVPPIGTAP